MASKLTYFKWMVDDAEVLKENLTKEQIGELFVAVMDYLQNGCVAELSPDLRIIYADYRKKVDRSRAACESISAKRAASGSLGGKAKAQNAQSTAPTEKKKFKPPTLKQFKNAVEQYVDEGTFDSVNDYNIESFYDSLCESEWKIDGTPVQCRADWESLIFAKFYEYGKPLIDSAYYQSFCAAFIRLEDSDLADQAVTTLWESFSEQEKCFTINGTVYQLNERKFALDAIIENYASKFSKCKQI